jgi:hypothetical protein
MSADVPPGSLQVGYRTCGRPTCRCARPGEQGRGPRGLWTRTTKGSGSRGQYIPVDQIGQVRAELDNCTQFAALVKDYVEINEALCKHGSGHRHRADLDVSTPLPRAGNRGSATRRT